MAGASDPLEDVLLTEVDEAAVSDLLGSLESQLGPRDSPAPLNDGKSEPIAPSAGHLSGKDPGGPSPEPGCSSRHTAAVQGSDTRTSSPGTLNGSMKMVNPAVPGPGPPPVAQNGLDSKPPPPALVQNHSGPLIHTKMILPSQPGTAGSVILTSTPSPVQAQSPVSQTPTSPATVTLTAGMKPTVNGVTPMRPGLVGNPGVQQRPGLVPGGPTRIAAPQPTLTVRPQQQTTIQLPPGFTIPPGMVLVRTEAGQLVMVPQQVLAQAQAKAAARPATPTAGAAIRVSTPPAPVRFTSPTPTRMIHTPTSTVPLTQNAVATPVKMVTPQKCPTVITASGAKPTMATPTAINTPRPLAAPSPRVTVVSQEMQENVKKCKNFLATLIKLASHNSPSPETSKNVKALVQDLLDAKIEPEEFTTRLQAELKSSPQPYLIPFLKKSLPALRQSLLNSQSLMTPPPSLAPPPVTPVTAIRPRVEPTGGAVRLHTPTTTAVSLSRTTVRPPAVINQTLRAPGALVRGTAIIRAPVNLAAQANQKKLSDPGGGTFRDDDDINDVASMAGVNLNEENARILATSSEIVGTKIRSCKDESFLPTALLHRRVLDTVRRLGVSDVSLDAINFLSHATQCRLRSLLEMMSSIAQHRADGGKEEDGVELTSDVRSQLRFFEQLERMEKQRKDEQERELLLKAAKSRARQEDPEQARLKQKAKEMQQQELAQMRQRDANLTALAAIGPRKKRKMESGGGATPEVSSGTVGASSSSSPRQSLRQRITRVNLRDFIFCLEQDRSSTRSLLLYKALLK
ncbi:transcription initiation factor TFIID subunit 4-like [Gouania willdenowi]|uniref:Transcription initiation factor TFIID subunit 4-like n=1 Tax=Gouania willdenowi TaxID=441366 RepID=A0A8C5EQJ5_GOUWI|nr:transcription initiation factor TFIID subunit 4-like [Gouania willdenowi]